MNLSVGTGCQASFDAWGAEEMKKAEEYALALRERFAGEENPDYDPSWFLLINPVASRQSRSTKNKLAFKEMMLVRHGFDIKFERILFVTDNLSSHLVHQDLFFSFFRIEA